MAKENKKPNGVNSRVSARFDELNVGEYLVRKELITEIWGNYDICRANVFAVYFNNYKKSSGKTFQVENGKIIRLS